MVDKEYVQTLAKEFFTEKEGRIVDNLGGRILLSNTSTPSPEQEEAYNLYGGIILDSLLYRLHKSRQWLYIFVFIIILVIVGGAGYYGGKNSH